MTDQSTPDGWGLSPAEIEQLAQDAVGEPDPADNEWRPAGGTLLGGVGQCLYDEIKGILDLTKLLWDIRQEIDVAADGEDNWEVFRNHSLDSAKVGMLFYELENGNRIFGQLPKEQQLALFRLYAKQEIVKETLKKMGKAGLGMLAAYDVFWSSYELLTLDYNQNLMKGLADAVSLFFTDAEWAELAEGGKALAERVTQLVEQQIEKDPWGSSGYAICLVALMISPTKIVKALRPLMGIIRTMGRATDAASLSRVLRSAGAKVPTWLGGPGPDAGDLSDAARAGDTIEDLGDAASDAQRNANNQVDSTEPIETANDASPEPTPDPNDRPTPATNATTTRILADDVQLRNKTAGEMAEIQARRELEADGYEVFELKEGRSQAGIDAVAVKRDPDTNAITEIKVVEVKSTQYADIPDTSLPSGRQASGGEGHLDTMLRDISNNQTSGKYGDDILDLADDINDATSSGVPIEAEVWRYRVNTFTDEVNQRATAPWTARSSIPADEFDIDTGFSTTSGLRAEALETVLERNPSYQTKYPELGR